MRITNELVEKKYSEGLESILDLLSQVSLKIKSLEEDNRKLKKAFSELKPDRRCPECIVKQFDIDKLEEKNKSLKSKLKYRQDQGYFGSSTSSSKKKFKEKSTKDNVKKRAAQKRDTRGMVEKSSRDQKQMKLFLWILGIFVLNAEIKHDIAEIFKPVADQSVPYLNDNIVKQTDETCWRIDDQNGYIWTFLSDRAIIFRVRKTRAGSVPKEIFGTDELKGYLVFKIYFEIIKPRTLKESSATANF